MQLAMARSTPPGTNLATSPAGIMIAISLLLLILAVALVALGAPGVLSIILGVWAAAGVGRGFMELRQISGRSEEKPWSR